MFLWFPKSELNRISDDGPNPDVELVAPRDEGPGEPALYGNVSTKGLPDNTYVVPAKCDFTFRDDQGGAIRFSTDDDLLDIISQGAQSAR